MAAVSEKLAITRAATSASSWAPAITLAAAMRDPQLLGGPFTAPSFWTWHAAAKVLSGEGLDDREAALFRQCTGRTRLPSGPVHRMVILVGRRGGKDRFFSAVAIHRAALAADWHDLMSVGEQAVVSLLGADKKQAGILRRYCEGLLRTPLLAREVVRSTDDVIEFRNGSALEIATNNAALVRGRSAVAVLGSECCYWRTDELASSSDEEVVAAAEPSMAMCPDGGLLLLGSSVYRQRGYMFRKFKELHGNDDADDICWLAPSALMNPALPAKVVERALADDVMRARGEFLSEWRADIQSFIAREVIEAATVSGRFELPPVPGISSYVGFCDPSGGSSDSMTLAVAHFDRTTKCSILDLIRERRAPFSPDHVVQEFAGLLKSYGVRKVTGDRYAGEWPRERFRAHGIDYEPAKQNKSDIYLAFLPALNSARAELLDNGILSRQLIGLERRAARGGRDVVDHTPGARDDVANAVCGALVLAASARRPLHISNKAMARARERPTGGVRWPSREPKRLF